jgi:cytochrome P450
VVSDIARQYPIPIICALLGAPSEDWELFSTWTDGIFKAFSWNAAAETPVILAAWDELDAYIDDMVARRRRVLTEDLISALIRAEDAGDRLNADELRMLVGGLLMAGTDTTRNQLAGSVHVLCDHPDQWALLAEHPHLAANAVEETMRHSPIAIATLRIALDNVELAGVMIPAGALVIANTGAANRDPAVYDDPQPPRHRPPGRPGHANLRRGHALLPRRQPRPPRARRSPRCHDAAHAQRSAYRSCPVEAADRDEWTHHVADPVRCCTEPTPSLQRVAGCRFYQLTREERRSLLQVKVR